MLDIQLPWKEKETFMHSSVFSEGIINTTDRKGKMESTNVTAENVIGIKAGSEDWILVEDMELNHESLTGKVMVTFNCDVQVVGYVAEAIEIVIYKDGVILNNTKRSIMTVADNGKVVTIKTVEEAERSNWKVYWKGDDNGITKVMHGRSLIVIDV